MVPHLRWIGKGQKVKTEKEEKMTYFVNCFMGGRRQVTRRSQVANLINLIRSPATERHSERNPCSCGDMEGYCIGYGFHDVSAQFTVGTVLVEQPCAFYRGPVETSGIIITFREGSQ